MSDNAATGSEEAEVRILILGKSKVGKSALGNIILGRKLFKETDSLETATVNCVTEEGEYENHSLIVLDTPALSQDTKEKFLSHIKKLSPGPHVILFVIEWEDYRKGDQKILEALIQEDVAASEHTIVVFTRGDPDEKEIEKYVVDNYINSLASISNFDQYHAVDKKSEKVENQKKVLMDKIIKMRNKDKRGGEKWFSNERFNDAFFEKLFGDKGNLYEGIKKALV